MTMTSTEQNLNAVIPAAGIGRRMGSDIPKQYLTLNNKRVIEHTIERLLSIRAIQKVVVVIAAHDELWPSLEIAHNDRVVTAEGGEERFHSVLNGLHAVPASSDDSWVLVHDAARPCIRPQDVTNMVEQLRNHPVGGILGAPVRDTLKKSDSANNILDTVDRAALWHAFTPQMFRLDTLRNALQNVVESQGIVTDEAQAIERSGLIPALVEGHNDNIKITHPNDLVLAGLYLDTQRANGII